MSVGVLSGIVQCVIRRRGDILDNQLMVLHNKYTIGYNNQCGNVAVSRDVCNKIDGSKDINHLV